MTHAIAREPDAFRKRYLKGRVLHGRRRRRPLTIKNKDAATDEGTIPQKIAFVATEVKGQPRAPLM
jgi:hypothetical protein